jgi:hypothetical protein
MNHKGTQRNAKRLPTFFDIPGNPCNIQGIGNKKFNNSIINLKSSNLKYFYL